MILDAGVVVAYARDEPGADLAEQLLLDRNDPPVVPVPNSRGELPTAD